MLLYNFTICFKYEFFDDSEVTGEDIKNLNKHKLKAAVLSSRDRSDADSPSSDQASRDPLEPLAALYDENLRGLSSAALEQKSDETFSRLRKEMTQEKSENLERIAKNQAQSQSW